MSLFLSYGSGIITLVIAWFIFKDLFPPVVVVVLTFSSIYLYVSGPNAIAFSLCLCTGWILLNSFIEWAVPISISVE
jgi:hypothetical protein